MGVGVFSVYTTKRLDMEVGSVCVCLGFWKCEIIRGQVRFCDDMFVRFGV